MEERKPILKILYENTEKPVNQVWLTFPLSGREKAEQRMLALTRGHERESSISFRIARVDSPIQNLGRYLPTDGWFQEISRLAEKIEGMGREEQMKFSGILDCCSISTIEDVLQAADSLSLYVRWSSFFVTLTRKSFDKIMPAFSFQMVSYIHWMNAGGYDYSRHIHNPWLHYLVLHRMKNDVC